MVFIDPEELKWLPYVQTWLNSWDCKLKPETKEYLEELFKKYVEEGLKFVNKEVHSDDGAGGHQ